MWRDYGLLRSYTMESTFSGSRIGPYAEGGEGGGAQHFSTQHFHAMGRSFALGLLELVGEDARAEEAALASGRGEDAAGDAAEAGAGLQPVGRG